MVVFYHPTVKTRAFEKPFCMSQMSHESSYDSVSGFFLKGELNAKTNLFLFESIGIY